MWLYLPTVCCPSAPAREPSTSELALHAQALAQSVTWSEELTKPSFWLRAWKRGTYPRLRSGATSPPSIQALGVASWIALLRAIPASPTAWPAPCSVPTMTDGCSITSSGSSTACGLVVSSVRTSRGMPTAKSATSLQHWKAWATALRAECSQREPPEPASDDSASSLWPAVTKRDHRSPNSQDSQDSQDRRNEGKKRGQQLMNFIAWELPEIWSTLTAAAAHGSQLTRGNERSNELLIGGQAILLCLRLDPETPDGATLSATNLGLNPQFAEWLMGWPIGWSELKPLGTELSQWRSLARGLVLKLASPPAPAGQQSLFA
jgi:hypothetical protein